jgi:YesN/AraC family two-component response regulator
MNVAHAFVLNRNAIMNGCSIKKSVTKVEEILNYLNSYYMHKITSAMLEEQYEVNFDYINRVFYERTGNTIFQYLNSIRISHAKELIGTTNLKFGEIAYLTGIEDAFYFTRMFKKFCGMTPTQYYKNCRSEAKD